MSYEDQDRLGAVESDMKKIGGTRAHARIFGFQEVPMNPNDNPALRTRRKKAAPEIAVAAEQPVQEVRTDIELGGLSLLHNTPPEELTRQGEDPGKVNLQQLSAGWTHKVVGVEVPADDRSRPRVACQDPVSFDAYGTAPEAAETTQQTELAGDERPSVRIEEGSRVTAAEGTHRPARESVLVPSKPSQELSQEAKPNEGARVVREEPARQVLGSHFLSQMQQGMQTTIQGGSALLQYMSPKLMRRPLVREVAQTGQQGMVEVGRAHTQLTELLDEDEAGPSPELDFQVPSAITQETPYFKSSRSESGKNPKIEYSYREVSPNPLYEDMQPDVRQPQQKNWGPTLRIPIRSSQLGDESPVPQHWEDRQELREQMRRMTAKLDAQEAEERRAHQQSEYFTPSSQVPQDSTPSTVTTHTPSQVDPGRSRQIQTDPGRSRQI